MSLLVFLSAYQRNENDGGYDEPYSSRGAAGGLHLRCRALGCVALIHRGVIVNEFKNCVKPPLRLCLLGRI